MTGIRVADARDVSIISKLAAVIWPKVYSNMISAEQIDYMLDLMYNVQTLTHQMFSGHTFILYYHQEQPMGFASYAPQPEAATFKLHKLYLHPALHRTGIGLMLLDRVIVSAKNAGGKRVILNVNKNNRTLGFYKKHGFTIIEEVINDIGRGFVMDDYVMQLKIDD